MNRKALRIVTWVLALIPLVAVALCYSSLPEQVPTHWGFDGMVDGYGSRVTLWLLAGLGPLLALLFPLARRADPRRKNYARFDGVYDWFILMMMLFFLVMNGVVLSESLNPGRLSVSNVVMTSVSLLFIFLGNVMPKIKSNFFFGLRTPWTLSDPEVWARANRLGGYCFFFGGLVLLAATWLLPERVLFATVMVVVLLMALIPSGMSYLWYRRKTPPEA